MMRYYYIYPFFFLLFYRTSLFNQMSRNPPHFPSCSNYRLHVVLDTIDTRHQYNRYLLYRSLTDIPITGVIHVAGVPRTRVPLIPTNCVLRCRSPPPLPLPPATVSTAVVVVPRSVRALPTEVGMSPSPSRTAYFDVVLHQANAEELSGFFLKKKKN
ncbi:hypothetical protein EDC94DRAFT_622865 [Helicostylum pulchrum]|nr:hypothetical protein EDC94DRAFT_622865 [Helicostylum pulchrum]